MNVLILLIALAQTTNRAMWIAADTGATAPCTFDADGWNCPRDEGSRGILVAIGADRVEIVSTDGVENVDTSATRWGRLVRVIASGSAPRRLRHLTLTASRPERSVVRAQLRRFRAIRDGSVRVLQLSDMLFWVSGVSVTDPDAFLALEGPDIDAVHVVTRRLREDAPENIFEITASPASSITGRVRNARGEDVPSVSVELLRPLRRNPDQKLNADTPIIGVASAMADENGLFAFDHVVETPVLVTVSSAMAGRGAQWVSSPGQPVVIELTPSLHARGRVLRDRVPLAGARVRFVPGVEAWAVSVDPAANLVEETATADDGSFDVALPEHPAGALQIVAADGATARVPILSSPAGTRTIELGDVSIPDLHRLLIRLLEPLQSPPCDLLAIGPLGNLGMQTVRASSLVNVYTLDLPESGQWTFSVDCGGRVRSVVPATATVTLSGSESTAPTLDLHFAR